MNGNNFAILEKPFKHFEEHREYCRECEGYVLVNTSYGDRIFCRKCNNLIKCRK